MQAAAGEPRLQAADSPSIESRLGDPVTDAALYDTVAWTADRER